jgi:hypothetical protein
MATRAKRKTSRRTAAAIDEGRLADLKVAAKTIGDTYAARLAWVVRFVVGDPASWHSAISASHGDCLVVLGRHGVGDLENLPPPLAPQEVAVLHAELRTLLRSLVGAGGARAFMVPIRTEGGSKAIVRLTGVGVRPALFALSYGHQDARSAILHTVADLVVQAGERLIACPVCSGPFVAVRKQRFCSPRCAQRVRNERKAARRT